MFGKCLWRSGGFAVFVLLTVAPAAAQTESSWRPIGLMRVRDMTPFGIQRLDLLPAHAVPATEGTWAFETNLTYQNTYVLSENVEEYLETRGEGRKPLTGEDLDAILSLGEDAYLVDGELGLVDLTIHHRFSSHWGGYLTIPYFYFDGGFLDSSIEGFHEGVGFSSAGRDLVPRNRFQLAANINGATIRTLEAPSGGELGDPVLGARYSLKSHQQKWNLVFEAAAKLAMQDEQALVSSGENDYGAQLTYQRFWSRRAFYLSLAGVYFKTFDERLMDDQWIPTLVLGYERRLGRNTNGILQFYASPSVVQDSTAEELIEDKYQVTLGLQRWVGDSVLRFGLTENVSNFGNTPDIGVTLGFARVLFGKD